MPYMILSQRWLPAEVVSEFVKGAFAVNLSTGPFKSIWIDYTLKTTENKELKRAGIIIGLTMKGDALLRWFLNRPITAQYANQFLKKTSFQ